MIMKKPGEITDRILLLGREESCVYLIKGHDEYALLGGGLSYIIPDVVSQLKSLQIDEKKINRLVIHHAHFDHVGAIPFLKRRWPWAKITASQKAKELLARPEIIKRIFGINTEYLSRYGLESRINEFGINDEPITVDDTVTDGDVRSCGELHLEFMDTPGHSPCSISVFIPEEKALSASDAGGIPFQNKVLTVVVYDYDQYQSSLIKLADLRNDVYLSEHYGAHTGEDGRNYIKRAITSSRETRAFIEEVLDQTQDVQESTGILKSLFLNDNVGYLHGERVVGYVLGAMSRCLARGR